MVRRHGGTVNRRAIGWGAAVGTAMVMAAAPAHAEVMDDLFDQLLAPFVDQVTDAALPGVAAADVSGWLQELVYAPLHDVVEGWINSAGATPLLDGLNDLSRALGLGAMIADGSAGTAAHPEAVMRGGCSVTAGPAGTAALGWAVPGERPACSVTAEPGETAALGAMAVTVVPAGG